MQNFNSFSIAGQSSSNRMKASDDGVLKDTPVEFDFKAIASLFKSDGIRWDPIRGQDDNVRCYH